jgi:hypothetical protein
MAASQPYIHGRRGGGESPSLVQLLMAPVADALAGMGYDFTVRESTALMRSKTLLTLLNCLFFAALTAFSYMAVASLVTTDSVG